MTESQTKFFVLTRKFETLKDEIAEVEKELSSVMADLGTGTYHQDPTTMAVYKVVVPKGSFVAYKTISYERTVIGDETRGTLSKKEAQEKGFCLTK